MWFTERGVVIQIVVRDSKIVFTGMTSIWFIFESLSVIQNHFRNESLSVSVMEEEHAIVLLLHSVCSTAYFC